MSKLDDTVLIDAERRLEELRASLGQSDRDLTDADMDSLNALQDLVAKTPDHTAGGVLVKFRLLNKLRGENSWSLWDEPLRGTITKALERLAGTGAPT